MKYFQLVAFIIEILFLTFIPVYFILLALNLAGNHESWLRSPNKFKVLLDILARAAFISFSIYVIYTSLFPRILDVPRLITGKFVYAEGYAVVYHEGGKLPYDYVYIGEHNARFFLESGIESVSEYKMGYLPHSKRGIYLEKSNTSIPLEERKVRFPFGPVIAVVYFILSIFLLRFAYWFLGAATITHFSVAIYNYILIGKQSGLWLSLDNEGLGVILGGIGFLLIVLVVYLVERFFKGGENYLDDMVYTLFFAQLIAYVFWLATLDLLNII